MVKRVNTLFVWIHNGLEDNINFSKIRVMIMVFGNCNNLCSSVQNRLEGY